MTANHKELLKKYIKHTAVPPRQTLASGFGGQGGEQDDLMRDIAMSLGENVMVSSDGTEAGTQQLENKEAEQQKEEEEEMSSDEQKALKQLLQANEETGKRMPLMITLKRDEREREGESEKMETSQTDIEKQEKMDNIDAKSKF